MDCQKLSREASAHAAQNDRLPVHTVVQVLYYEQQRLRDVMNGNIGGESSVLPSKGSVYSTDVHMVPDELTILRRQNEELKIELGKMRMKLKELETSTARTAMSSPMGNTPISADKPPLPRKSFMNLVSKRLGKISPFVRADGVTPTGTKGRTKSAKDRRHSISWSIGVLLSSIMLCEKHKFQCLCFVCLCFVSEAWENLWLESLIVVSFLCFVWCHTALNKITWFKGALSIKLERQSIIFFSFTF